MAVGQSKVWVKTSAKDSILVEKKNLIFITKSVAQKIAIERETCMEIKTTNLFLEQDVENLKNATEERTDQLKQQFDVSKKMDTKFATLISDFNILKKAIKDKDIFIESLKEREQKALRKNDKRVSIGIYVGYGMGFTLPIAPTAQIGIGIGYRIFRL